VEEGRIELEEKIFVYIRELVLPYIDRLKKHNYLIIKPLTLIVIENILTISSLPFLYHLKMRYLNLTHREVQVASLVKEGKSNKENRRVVKYSYKLCYSIGIVFEINLV